MGHSTQKQPNSLFTNDLEFIVFLLEKHHNVKTTPETVWTEICQMAGGSAERAETFISLVVENDEAFDDLAKGVRSRLLSRKSWTQVSEQPKKFDPLVFLDFLFIAFVGGLIGFVIGLWIGGA